MDAMPLLPLRLQPGEDLRRALEAAVANQGCEAGFVAGGIGSLDCARLRLVGHPARRVDFCLEATIFDKSCAPGGLPWPVRTRINCVRCLMRNRSGC
jgi:hypothetical protein